ncbi:MAG: hypothetical protein HGA36_04900 [Candidatus Moranbacteria bacterium]|nr:hypothetical protein [Candidatus Moranbacteria bacterium]
MKLSEKIEQIRREPENVRIRYVWGSVAVSMFFIVAIWIFSIGSLFQKDETQADSADSTVPDISEQLQNIKQQAPSIKDFTEQSLNAGSAATESIAKEDAPALQTQRTEQTEIPQTSAYSDLSDQMLAQ